MTGIGWKARAALDAGGVARVLAPLSASIYMTVDADILWLGPAGATLHPRAILCADALEPPGAIEPGELVRVDATGVAPWRPAEVPATRDAAAALSRGAARLGAAAQALGAPDGFGALLVGARPGFPLDAAADLARALASACAADRLEEAAQAAWALLGLGAGLIIPFMNRCFRDRFGLSEGEIGALFAVMQGFMVVGNLFGPAVSRRIGLVGGVVATQLASVPFMVVLALSGNFPLVAAAFFLRSGLMNMNQPLASHFAMEVVSERDHAVTNSLLSLAWFLAWSLSADIGGALIERKGYTEPLLIAAGLYVAASILYWVFFKDVEEASVPRSEVEIPEA